MVSSFSGLVNNLTERLNKSKCENCESGLEYVVVKDNTMTLKCLDCNKNYKKEFYRRPDKKISKRISVL